MGILPWPDRLLSLDDWDALPEDPTRRFELIEGVMLVVPRPASLHQRAMVRLAEALDRQLSDGDRRRRGRDRGRISCARTG